MYSKTLHFQIVPKPGCHGNADRSLSHQFRGCSLRLKQFLKRLDRAVLNVKHGGHPPRWHALVPNANVHCDISRDGRIARHGVMRSIEACF